MENNVVLVPDPVDLDPAKPGLHAQSPVQMVAAYPYQPFLVPAGCKRWESVTKKWRPGIDFTPP
jgi:hypothetical protein